jgi:hypothetical protein
MTTTLEEAKAAAERAARGDILSRLLEMTAKAGTEAVFGTPVERGGRTVITVARVRSGFGGASGSPGGEMNGESGGGGMMADPVGYLELGPAGAEFRNIGGERPSAPFMLAAGLAGWLVLSGIAKVLRSLRR